jgi:Xaa-Pro aminopeptidase
VTKIGTGISHLTLLRTELARRNLDGFIVPRSDEHQGEYVPPSAQRLAWLTGFTGSAGAAVVLKDRAAFFTDGRYTLQAAAEVDGRAFELLHLVDAPPTQWIETNLPAGARLGYDSWLHTPDGVARLKESCEKAGGELVAVEGNPLDAVWRDRPAPPTAPITPHSTALAGQSAQEKRMAIADTLSKDHLDAAVLTAPDSIAWLLNVRGGDVPYTPLPLSFALIHADGRVSWFVDQRKLTPGLKEHLGNGVEIAEPDGFGPALDELAEKRVRLDHGTAPAWVRDRLVAAKAKVARGADPCQLPKACKNRVELQGTRDAHRRDGVALAGFLAWLAEVAPKGGLGEIAVADKLESFRAKGAHFRGLSFPTIAGAGPNGAIVHYRASPATERKIEPGQLFLLDSGAQYEDGTTDVTRTIAIGPAGAEERRRFTLVLKGHIALALARFPGGTTGSQLDALARRALWEEGLDYDHGTGHGVGSFLGVHEGPQRIAKTPSSQPLLPGMIVSDEPGYYKTGAYGIRIENLVAVKEDGRAEGSDKPWLAFETLTLAPIDLALVERDLLTSAERDWLNAYHARVRSEIGPLVDAATAKWLEKATGAI